jgi:DNA end-binding protein Ku
MATTSARSTWRGSLRLSLIAIPIRAFPATRPDADVSFRQFHRKCHTRIQMRKWCPHCELEVDGDDIVKGHETSKGRYVFVDKDDVDKLRPESSTVLSVSDVIDARAIDARFIERVYYLAPDSKEAGSAFAVVRDALDGRAAIGRLALHGREYLVAVIRDEKALRLYTLRTAGEVRSQDGITGMQLAGGRVKPDELKLARRVIDSFESNADLTTFVDNYQVALRNMLRKKGAGKEVETGSETATPKVVNLMDALRQSLDSARKHGAKKATPVRRRKARVIQHTTTHRKARRAS